MTIPHLAYLTTFGVLFYATAISAGMGHNGLALICGFTDLVLGAGYFWRHRDGLR